MAQHVDEKVAVGAHTVDAGARQRVGEQSRRLTAHQRYETTLASMGS